jgi:mitochondrial fission protein ELM1
VLTQYCYKTKRFMTQNPSKPPLVWLLASPHAGDNTQLNALAESLGWPVVVKQLSYKPWQTAARLVFGATLAGLENAAAAQIVPPYPDIIIGAGRPTEAVALWIKKHGNKNVKLVYLGTPWAKLSEFDLVITTPQYRLPKRSNVLHNNLPLHKVEPHKLREAALVWEAQLSHFPRPWTAVLVGGPSGPYQFSVEAAHRLGVQASLLGGSLLVSTSARTPREVSSALQATLSISNHFHNWSSGGSSTNPLLGYLALADQFIVTADSISMLSEACATGKPVMLFDIEDGRFSMRDDGGPIAWRGRNLSSTAFRLAMRVGPPSWSRDLRIVHRQLIDAGRVRWLGEPKTADATITRSDDLARATSRVKALFNL